MIIVGILTFILGRKMIPLILNPKAFRLWVQEIGMLGKFVIIGISALQIVVAIIPGEPIEIAAGYAFGWLEGAIYCVIGNLLGQTVVFLLSKKFGMKFVEIIVSKQRLSRMKILKDSTKVYMTIFFVFLIPGTPKDVISYVAGITSIRLLPFLLVSGVGRIPSVISSTIGGSYIGTKNYKMAVVVFVVTIIVSSISLIVYKSHERRKVNY